jgi:hypothetical protein
MSAACVNSGKKTQRAINPMIHTVFFICHSL